MNTTKLRAEYNLNDDMYIQIANKNQTIYMNMNKINLKIIYTVSYV